MSYNTTLASFVPPAYDSVHGLDFVRNAFSRYYVVVAALLSALSVLFIRSRPPNPAAKEFPYKSGLPIVGSWRFFTHRNSFIEDGMKRLGGIFSFRIMQHLVIVVSGAEARRTFFSSKELNFSQGYRFLLGAAPKLDDIGVDTEHPSGDSWFRRKLMEVLRADRLCAAIPLMFADLERSVNTWGDSGTFNPFDNIYSLVFQLTVRAGACREIADDPSAVARLTQLYWTVERGSAPESVLFPWLPSPARVGRKMALVRIYLMLKKHVVDRQQTGRREEDAMQLLLDDGAKVNDVTQFVMSVLFAGIINTGIISSWIVLFLHTHPEWKVKVKAEINEFIAKYAIDARSAPHLSESGSQPSLAEQLARLPPHVWDTEMSVLENCLRETMRMVMIGALLRRAVEDGVTIAGKPVPRGAFLAFPIGSTHHDPSIYPAPKKWDPSRYERGEDKKEQWAYLGWGVGRHPCLGMRFAKLEMKAIVALFLAQFDYDVVDASGEPISELPPPERDNRFQAPPSKPVFVRYRRMSS